MTSFEADKTLKSIDKNLERLANQADKTLKSIDKNLERLANQIQWNNWLTYYLTIYGYVDDTVKERIENGIGLHTMKHKDA